MRSLLLLCWTLFSGLPAYGFGPVDLESIEALTLSWNQIHWLVKDQIKEVEGLKAEHDEIYNQITECFGLDKCVAEFDLNEIQEGRRLHNLGLRKMSVASLVSEDLIRQREQLHSAREKLEAELREKQRLLQMAEKQQRLEAEQRRQQEEEERMRQEEERRRLSSSVVSSSASSSKQQTGSSSSGTRTSSSSSSSSFSSYSSSSSSSRSGGGSNVDGGWSLNSTWPDRSIYGPKPQIYERRYEYSSSSRRTSGRTPSQRPY